MSVDVQKLSNVRMLFVLDRIRRRLDRQRRLLQRFKLRIVLLVVCCVLAYLCHIRLLPPSTHDEGKHTWRTL